MEKTAQRDRAAARDLRQRMREVLAGLGYHVDSVGGYAGTHLYPTPQVPHTCLELQAYPEHLQLTLTMDINPTELSTVMVAAQTFLSACGREAAALARATKKAKGVG